MQTENWYKTRVAFCLKSKHNIKDYSVEDFKHCLAGIRSLRVLSFLGVRVQVRYGSGFSKVAVVWQQLLFKCIRFHLIGRRGIPSATGVMCNRVPCAASVFGPSQLCSWGLCEGFLLLCSSFLRCKACVGSIFSCVGSIFSCIGLGLEACTSRNKN